MRCRLCDAELRDGAKFCPKCGSSIVEQMKEVDNNVICSNCGTEYKKEFVVCPTCGTVYDETQTESYDVADNHEESQIPVCPNCGKEIVPGKSFCKFCGTKLNGAPKAEETFAAYEEPKQQPVYNTATSNGLLLLNEFMIDEKLSAFKFENSYKIYDMNGNLAGAIIQDAVSGGAAAARVLMGKNTKALQKFGLTIVSSEGEKLGRIYRDGGGFATIYVENASGQVISSMKLRMGKLSDESGNMVCKFGVGFTTVPLKDEMGNELATVTWKWNGAKTLFFTADKYRVTLSPTLSGNQRFIILAITCAYDMLAGDR